MSLIQWEIVPWTHDVVTLLVIKSTFGYLKKSTGHLKSDLTGFSLVDLLKISNREQVGKKMMKKRSSSAEYHISVAIESSYHLITLTSKLLDDVSTVICPYQVDKELWKIIFFLVFTVILHYHTKDESSTDEKIQSTSSSLFMHIVSNKRQFHLFFCS